MMSFIFLLAIACLMSICACYAIGKTLIWVFTPVFNFLADYFWPKRRLARD